MIYCNEHRVTLETFPNGEVRIPKDQDAFREVAGGPVTLRLSYREDADLLHLLFVRQHLTRLDAHPVDLVLDYMPYSRMDRATSDLFTLTSVAHLLNSLDFRRVTVHEPHSDVTTALLNNCVATYPSATWLLELALEDIGFRDDRDPLFFPDAGAQKRYEGLGVTRQHLVGTKRRPDGPGGVFDYRVSLEGVSVRLDARVVIVDDLCSKGGTFLAAARALQEVGFSNLWLVVTHLEESFWQGDLVHEVCEDGLLRGVYTTNSLSDPTSEWATSGPRRPVHFFDLVTHERLSHYPTYQGAH